MKNRFNIPQTQCKHCLVWFPIYDSFTVKSEMTVNPEFCSGRCEELYQDNEFEKRVGWWDNYNNELIENIKEAKNNEYKRIG